MLHKRTRRNRRNNNIVIQNGVSMKKNPLFKSKENRAEPKELPQNSISEEATNSEIDNTILKYKREIESLISTIDDSNLRERIKKMYNDTIDSYRIISKRITNKEETKRIKQIHAKSLKEYVQTIKDGKNSKDHNAILNSIKNIGSTGIKEGKNSANYGKSKKEITNLESIRANKLKNLTKNIKLNYVNTSWNAAREAAAKAVGPLDNDPVPEKNKNHDEVRVKNTNHNGWNVVYYKDHPNVKFWENQSTGERQWHAPGSEINSPISFTNTNKNGWSLATHMNNNVEPKLQWYENKNGKTSWEKPLAAAVSANNAALTAMKNAMITSQGSESNATINALKTKEAANAAEKAAREAAGLANAMGSSQGSESNAAAKAAAEAAAEAAKKAANAAGKAASTNNVSSGLGPVFEKLQIVQTILDSMKKLLTAPGPEINNSLSGIRSPPRPGSVLAAQQSASVTKGGHRRTQRRRSRNHR